jgi:hypothetical protein
MSKQVKFQSLGWADAVITESDDFAGQEAQWRKAMDGTDPNDQVEELVDDLYDGWRGNYQHTCNCEEHDMQLAFELGCHAAFEHGDWVLTDVNNITEDILREYHVKSDRGTIDAFRGGVEAILANQSA